MTKIIILDCTHLMKMLMTIHLMKMLIRIHTMTIHPMTMLMTLPTVTKVMTIGSSSDSEGASRVLQTCWVVEPPRMPCLFNHQKFGGGGEGGE